MKKLKIILIFVFIGAISVIGGAYFKINSTTSHENFDTKIFYNSITGRNYKKKGEVHRKTKKHPLLNCSNTIKCIP